MLVESLQTKNVELERQLNERGESVVLAHPASPPSARKRKAAAARVRSSEDSSSEDDWAGPAAPSPSRRPPRRKSRDSAAESTAQLPPLPPLPRVRALTAAKSKQARKRAALKLVSSDDDNDDDDAATVAAAAEGEPPRQAIIKLARTGSFASEFEPRPATPPEPTHLPTLAELQDLSPSSAKGAGDPTLPKLRSLAWGTWWTAAPMRDLPPPLVGRSAGPAPGAQDYVVAVVRPAAGTHAQAAWERLATRACLTPIELTLVRGIAGGMLRPPAPLGAQKVRCGISCDVFASGLLNVPTGWFPLLRATWTLWATCSRCCWTTPATEIRS